MTREIVEVQLTYSVVEEFVKDRRVGGHLRSSEEGPHPTEAASILDSPRRLLESTSGRIVNGRNENRRSAGEFVDELLLKRLHPG